MSTATDRQPVSALGDLPPAPRGSLLKSELHRFRARRFIQVLIGLALIGWVLALVIALLNFGTPTDADYADARAELQQVIADQEVFRQQCLNDPGPLPEGVSAEDACGPPLTEEDFGGVEQFLNKAPFDFVSTGTTGAVGFAALAAALAFVVGATWIGAEWSTRSLVALLFWVPRRTRVMGTKIGVLVLASALFGVAAQAGWLVMGGILRTAVGTDDPLPDGFWGELLAVQGRSVLLTALAALLGFGLSNLIRNTGAALGIGFVYFAVVETAVRAIRPSWQPWLLTNNAAGLLLPGGLEIPDYDNLTAGPEGFGQPTIYLLENMQAGVTLTIVTAVVLGVGVILFMRRDVQ